MATTTRSELETTAGARVLAERKLRRALSLVSAVNPNAPGPRHRDAPEVVGRVLDEAFFLTEDALLDLISAGDGRR